MKKQSCFVWLLVLVAGLVPAYAQSSATARFHIPFEFVAGDVTLPAGDYVVTYSSQNSALEIRSRAGNIGMTKLTQPVYGESIKSGAILVFNRYGAKSFLAQLWLSDSNRGRKIPQSKYEREMAQGLKTKTIQLAAY